MSWVTKEMSRFIILYSLVSKEHPFIKPLGSEPRALQFSRDHLTEGQTSYYHKFRRGQIMLLPCMVKIIEVGLGCCYIPTTSDAHDIAASRLSVLHNEFQGL